MAFLPLSSHAVRRHRIQAICELANFFYAITRLNFAFLTFSHCVLLLPACARQFLLRQPLSKIAHLQLFANFLLPFCVVLICLFNRCFLLDCCC